MSENKKYIVYMHIFPNDKKYIGITCVKPYERRWRNGTGYCKQPKIYNAILKYGWENIKHIILYKNISLEEANQKEIESIQKYNCIKNGYNISIGGGGTNGIPCSEKTKLKISKANKGREHSEISKNNLKEYIKTHGSWNKGKKLSKRHLEKVAKKNKSRCNKKVYALDKNTFEIIKVFKSCTEASIYMGVSKTNISRCCNGGRPTAAGYIWRYADENNSKFSNNYRESNQRN